MNYENSIFFLPVDLIIRLICLNLTEIKSCYIIILYIQIIQFYLIYINSIFATPFNISPKVNSPVNTKKVYISITRTSAP
jgi:hypothetical protein